MGYIATKNLLICGVGDTADAAWDDCVRDARANWTERDTDWSFDQGPNRDGYALIPASDELIQAVRDRGGAGVKWEVADRVASLAT